MFLGETSEISKLGSQGMAQDRPSWLPLVNLLGITRDTDVVETTIEVMTPQGYFPWLQFGSLSRLDVGENTCWIGARAKEEVVDEEHKSVYAFRFYVTHVKFGYVSEGVVVLESCISGSNGDALSFDVPEASISEVSQIPNAEPCEPCDAEPEAHLMVKFVPKKDDKPQPLWRYIRGCKIRINICPKRSGTE